MSEYKFTYEDTEYILNANNCSELINDEEKPVKGITVDSILNMLNEADDVDFDIVFSRCKRKAKVFWIFRVSFLYTY